MRLSLLVIALSLATVLPAHAAEDAATPPSEQEDVAEERDASSVDSLFETLRRETRSVAARRVADQIARKWTESGSDTINLLMGWAGDALNKKNNALAEDLLDQVVTLQPGYAEGWNRRATLYYAMGDFGRSLADIERTLQLEPRHFGAMSGLAVILQKTGQNRKALEVWNKVLTVYPASEQAQKSVIEIEDDLAGQAS